MQIHPEVRAYMAQIGSKGGKVLSPAKLAQLRAAAKRPKPRKDRYFAEVIFSGGMTCHAKSGSLAKLLRRIRNNFAGETTDWGKQANGKKIIAYTVEDRNRSTEHNRCIVASGAD